MPANVLVRTRHRFGVIASVLGVLSVVWIFLPGLPVWRAPRADAKERVQGQALFLHEWAPHDPLAHGDGLGPVFNGRSCASCHFQGGVGGGGGNDHNVLAFEAHPTKTRPDVKGGLVHKYAVASLYREDVEGLKPFFPIVKGGVRTISGCQVVVQDFDPVQTESINATALFGAGWIDRISAKTVLHEFHSKSFAKLGHELTGDFRSMVPGRPRILPDGRLGKFGWKAQFATLEEFVAAACANEIGLGNPQMEQARPWVLAKYPAVAQDLDRDQFRSLVSYVDTLPRPVETVPAEAAGRSRAERGRELFGKVGCAACHTPKIGGVEGVYSDFLLHRLDDPTKTGPGGYAGRVFTEVPLPEDHPLPEEWKTPPLWGVADSAPYFHDGKTPTLEAAIERHSGDAESVLEAFGKLSADDKSAVIAFLKTLRAPSAEGRRG